ncbi:MAG: hypothetical protein ACR2I5_06125 [Candidatus Limnocylindria bacterium]
MRAAAFIAGSIVTIGLYLVLAAAFAFSATAIGLGLLAISLVAAVIFVVTDRPAGRPTVPVSGPQPSDPV